MSRRRISAAFVWTLGTAFASLAIAASERDGQHDFDFDIGVWQTHIKRVMNPLSGSADSIELSGTVTVRKVWHGRAQLEEIEADGPKGHWEGLSLFLYNPEARQWSQAFSNSKAGTLGSPFIGSFKDGRGELFALYLAGFTDVQLEPQDERRLLEYGCGITAIVSRPTRRASEVSGKEFKAARPEFDARIKRYAPRSIAILGKNAFPIMLGQPKLSWGRQLQNFSGAMTWILPNPSGLNRSFARDALVTSYSELRRALKTEKRSRG